MTQRNRYAGGYHGNEGGGGGGGFREGREGGFEGRQYGGGGGGRDAGAAREGGGYFGGRGGHNGDRGGDRHGGGEHRGGGGHHGGHGGGGHGQGGGHGHGHGGGGGGGYYSRGFNNNQGGGGDGGRRQQQGPPVGDNQFAVMDMGLDFRSYQHILDENNSPALGNVVLFPVDKIPDVFQPTVGLLVAIVHMYSVSRTHDTARVWLGVYETVQMLHQGSGQARDDGKYAAAAVKSIKSHTSSQHPDRKLTERLLTLLDSQSGMPSGQLPSQRRIPPNPKGTFCNLHLSDHKCNLDFACNQIHLHEVGPSVKHRVDFHVRMVNLLIKAGTNMEEIHHRIKDSLFYAKFGNRVTVRCNNMSIPFFKTQYTPDRLNAALGRCKQRPVILAQDNVQSSKPLELHTPIEEVDSELDHGCAEVFAVIEAPAALNTPKQLPASPTMSNSSAHGHSLVGPSLMDSPTLDPWESTVREYVRESGIHQNRISEQLLLSLQAGASTSSNPGASGSDCFTPLMREAMRSMDSDTSMDNFEDLP